MLIEDRILQLEKLLEEDASDPFLYYALCLEFSKISNERSESLWLELISRFPDYLPSYYQAGLTLVEIRKRDEAIQLWKKGITLAELQNDRHALTELKSILQNTLLDELEED